jgi:hypothetical protein
MRALGLLVLTFAFHGGVTACTLPAPQPAVEVVPGTRVPFFDDRYYAFIGRVVGSSVFQGSPGLDVEVIDPWTPVQRSGEMLHVSVIEWRGCLEAHVPSRKFAPAEFPIGVRVRVVSRSLQLWEADLEHSLLVIGKAL